jgi:hypothetical protein
MRGGRKTVAWTGCFGSQEDRVRPMRMLLLSDRKAHLGGKNNAHNLRQVLRIHRSMVD